MTDEIKERPDRATGPREVWECEMSPHELIDVWEEHTGALRCSVIGKSYTSHMVSELPPGRYRIRTLEEKPWPPEKVVEKRRVSIWRSDDGDHDVEFYRADLQGELKNNSMWCVVSDEIRDCEIVDGKVVRVLPINYEQ